mmetsp:Transcript_8588/g.21512  ORF Transcript_8588/g.21512 Transcript_8588/m.21512 type:complete len:779 (+) Transcript_8588:100-2436(+)
MSTLPLTAIPGGSQHRIPGTARRSVPTSSTTTNDGDYSKYAKRRGQQSQKMRRALLLMLVSLCVLGFTLWHIGVFDRSRQDHHHPHGPHGTHPRPSTAKNKNKDHGGGANGGSGGGRSRERDDTSDGDDSENDNYNDNDKNGQQRRRPHHHHPNREDHEQQQDDATDRNAEEKEEGHNNDLGQEENVEEDDENQKRRQQEERHRQWQRHRHEQNEEEQKNEWGAKILAEGEKRIDNAVDHHRSDAEEGENSNNDGGNFLFSDSDNDKKDNRRNLEQQRQEQNNMSLKDQLKDLDHRIHNNEDRGTVWTRMDLVPSLSSSRHNFSNNIKPLLEITHAGKRPQRYFRVSRRSTVVDKNKRQQHTKTRNKEGDDGDHLNDVVMAWERHDEETSGQQQKLRDDFVDYTKHQYKYPEKLVEPPSSLGDYPKLMPLEDIMTTWPQDEIDQPPHPIEEVLIHFDFNDPDDMKAAEAFREAKLPFKVTNVPEVIAAGNKWTDEYVSKHFDTHEAGVMTEGNAQESPSNFFSWFQPTAWDVEEMGIPPTRNNNWSYAQWARHARYADRVGLSENRPHFYWQSNAEKEERRLDPKHWTFISKDLPSFSSTTKNFFLFEPEQQKGIQCRFGERGVTAATHFDGGRNMVAMMTGAKRYILSPPRECSRLGIVTNKGNAVARHSALNFGHISKIDDPDMPEEEREWMEYSSHSMALSTVLKAGEVLYIPSHWFHYIISLQKSAQCNVRSGVDKEGDEVFGGLVDVTDRCIPGEDRANEQQPRTAASRRQGF